MKSILCGQDSTSDGGA